MRKLTTQELIGQKPTLTALQAKKRQPISVVLNNVRSLQNVGLCFRLADAILAQKLYLGGLTGYPPLAKGDKRRPGIVEHAKHEIEKTAIRTVDYVPWEYHQNTVKLIKRLKSQGVQIVVLEQTDQSIDYQKANYQFPLALVLGHEREGVEDEVLNLADQVVEIPILGMGNSLNVATTLAIVGYYLVQKLP